MNNYHYDNDGILGIRTLDNNHYLLSTKIQFSNINHGDRNYSVLAKVNPPEVAYSNFKVPMEFSRLSHISEMSINILILMTYHSDQRIWGATIIGPIFDQVVWLG